MWCIHVFLCRCDRLGEITCQSYKSYFQTGMEDSIALRVCRKNSVRDVPRYRHTLCLIVAHILPNQLLYEFRTGFDRALVRTRVAKHKHQLVYITNHWNYSRSKTIIVVCTWIDFLSVAISGLGKIKARHYRRHSKPKRSLGNTFSGTDSPSVTKRSFRVWYVVVQCSIYIEKTFGTELIYVVTINSRIMKNCPVSTRIHQCQPIE